MDQPWENRGPDNCDKCGVACYTSELIAQGCGDMLCAGCDEARAISQAEQAAEDEFAAYHGGDAPDYVYENMAAKVERDFNRSLMRGSN